MAQRAKDGWLALVPKRSGFWVENEEGDGHLYPTAIYIHGNPRTGVYMDYAGVDGAPNSIRLPSDSKILADIAEAFSGLAADIEKKFGP
jgi:hypothetical protein